MSLTMRSLVLCVLISSITIVAAEDETLDELQFRAEQGDVKAQSELCAKHTVIGDADPPDAAVIVEWCRKAAEEGYAEGQFGLGVMLSLGQDNAQAAKWFHRAAEQGHARAQAALGMMYIGGVEGVPQNYTEALNWARKAADQGDALGQFTLGLVHANGWGVSQDDAEAEKWFLKGLEEHDPEDRTLAQFNMGNMYAEGENVPQSDAEAAKWYRRAAEQGLAKAQFKLGIMYELGKGVPKNNIEAMEWYLAAAEQGHTEAKDRLRAVYATETAFQAGTEAYERGEFTVAMRKWHPLAKQGDARAQTNLGHLYGDGKGVPQNDTEAVKWYRRAAEQGHAAAQAILGAMYANGRGTPQNNVQAYAWLNIAVAQGYTPAEEARDLVAEGMTPKVRDRAQRLAQEYWEAYVLPFRN